MFDKRLMKLCPESKKYIIGNIVFQWLELILNAVMIWIVADNIQDFYYKEKDVSDLIFPVFIILCTVILRFITTRCVTRMSYLASKTVKKKLRQLIYEKLLRLGVNYREKVSTSELVQESVEGVDQLESYFGQYVPQFFYAFIAPLTLFFLFGFGGSWFAAAILLICVPLIPGTIMMVQKFAKKLLAKYWGQYTELGSTFLENLQGMTTLKTYQADEFKNQEMNKESENFRFVTMKVLTMQLNSIIIMDFFTYSGAAIGIIIATNSFVNGSVSLAACIFMILLSAEFFLPMRRLGSYFHVAMNGMAASDKIFKFLNSEDDLDKTLDINEIKDIRIENLSFEYEEDREVIHGIDIVIPRNSFVGIVGESGCGKSTVASLLIGKNTYNKGHIFINGKELKEINEKALLKEITYVSHNSFFFKGSVRDNLLLGKKAATDEELWTALKSANLDEFFRNEKGLETELLENAANISGGQKQRLALARALLHDSDMYIFDEATSNIDVDSEEIILNHILEMKSKKTVLFISHRLMNTVNADNIYVMDKGKIVDRGKHSDLLEKCKIYHKLWNTQQELENYGKEVM
ncbi:MAG: ABC transporter ATP-binding protein/permease [Butyrivibrio sp.]|nr:ABC transporter ATP-binding protein/permease [Butyrivibrio sp.]